MSSSEPSKWATALGASADVNVIPATTPAGTGLASMASIFPAITQVPIDSGGIAPERAGMAGIPDPIGIGFTGSEKTGVETGRNFTAVQHPDIRRKHCVKHKRIFIRRDCRFCIKMDFLIQRMNTGIRTARRRKFNAVSKDNGQLLFQNILHRNYRRTLPLKTMISCTIIGHF